MSYDTHTNTWCKCSSFNVCFQLSFRSFSLDAKATQIMHLINKSISVSDLSLLWFLLEGKDEAKNRTKHISVCLSGVPTTCNIRLFIASYVESHMFPIDAPEDGMLKDDAGDVGGGKPWNRWKRVRRIIRICKNLKARLKLMQTSGNQHWKKRHERQRKWNQRKRKSGRWGGAGWMGVCKENPPELVIRLALLLHLWWRRSGFWTLACKDTGVDAEEACSVKRPARRPWTLSTVNACYSIFQLHKLLHNRKPILFQTDVSYGRGQASWRWSRIIVIRHCSGR